MSSLPKLIDVTGSISSSNPPVPCTEMKWSPFYASLDTYQILEASSRCWSTVSSSWSSYSPSSFCLSSDVDFHERSPWQKWFVTDMENMYSKSLANMRSWNAKSENSNWTSVSWKLVWTMTFALHFYGTRCHRDGYAIRNRIQHPFVSSYKKKSRSKLLIGWN